MNKKSCIRIVSLFLLIVITFSSFKNVAHGKYVLTDNGILAYSFFTNKNITETFVVTDEDLGDDNSATSENKHGILGPDGKIDASKKGEYSIESLNGNILYTVQNNTDHNLLVLFDIIICKGLINAQLACTITEEESQTSLTVFARTDNNNGNEYISMQQNTSIDASALNNWGVQYYAYETQVNPSLFLNKTYSENHSDNGIKAGDTMLTEEDLYSFILVPPGNVKTFSLSVEHSYINWWEGLAGGLDNNCYASITMTCVPYP